MYPLPGAAVDVLHSIHRRAVPACLRREIRDEALLSLRQVISSVLTLQDLRQLYHRHVYSVHAVWHRLASKLRSCTRRSVCTLV